MSLEYQSPNGQWYPYSFLQGNNATNTWISANPWSMPCNDLQPIRSTGTVTKSTVVNSANISTVTKWDQATGGMGALAQAPMFAKADPRSIRYNSAIGVVNLANPPMTVTSAGIIGSIWPSPYDHSRADDAIAFPVPTPAGSPNPAVYSQLGDNGPAGSNAYSEAATCERNRLLTMILSVR